MKSGGPLFRRAGADAPATEQIEASLMEPSERMWRETGLVQAVLRGDERAWEKLYQEAFDPLYRYVHWRCAGAAEEVEEVVQETWLVAVRRIGSFSPQRGSFLDWLRGIAANVLRNRVRRRSNRPAFQHLAQLPCRSDDTCQGAEDRARQVAEALGRLPAQYEAALRAKYVDRLSVAEIAARLGRTTKAAESLLARARQAFRHAYSKAEEDDD